MTILHPIVINLGSFIWRLSELETQLLSINYFLKKLIRLRLLRYSTRRFCNLCIILDIYRKPLSVIWLLFRDNILILGFSFSKHLMITSIISSPIFLSSILINFLDYNLLRFIISALILIELIILFALHLIFSLTAYSEQLLTVDYPLIAGSYFFIFLTARTLWV